MTIALENLSKLRAALQQCGLDFVITRHDDKVAHINVYIGDEND